MSAKSHRRTGSADLRTVQVGDVMAHPLITCAHDVPLHEVAELMAEHRVHSIVVLTAAEEGAPFHRRWALLSDLDLVAAAPWESEVTTAGSVAGSPSVVVGPRDSLAAAALSMAEHQTTHILVVEPGADEPVGILSALDLARALSPPPPPPQAAPAPRPAARLRARPGDRLVITPHHQGDRPRDAEILEARGPGGGPPFLVRWEDTGRVSLHYPGSDAVVGGATGEPSA
jgi:CBS domain-containing protein